MKRPLHPLSFFVLCLFYSSLAIASQSPGFLLIVFILAWLCEFRRGPKVLWTRLQSLKKLIWLVLSLVIIQLLFRRGGGIVLDLGIIKIYRDALTSSAFLALRIMIIYLCALSLSGMDFNRYRAAFATLRLPEEISFMISYMAQLIPHYSAMFKDQMRELKDRGIIIRKLSLKDKLKLYKLLALAALAELILMSGRQAIALEIRGFRSKGKRSSLDRYSFGLYDLGILLWILGILVLIYCFTRSWNANCILVAML